MEQEQRGMTRPGEGPDRHLGEVRTAAALVTAMCGDMRWLLLAESSDGEGWKAPSARVDAGESGAEAAVRGLAEETGLAIIDTGACRPLRPGCLPAPGHSGAVTDPVEIDLGPVATLPAVTGRGEATRAEWIPADSYPGLVRFLEQGYDGTVSAAHAALLACFTAPAQTARRASELTAPQRNGG